jgi:hypothetical protein
MAEVYLTAITKKKKKTWPEEIHATEEIAVKFYSIERITFSL